MDDLIYKSERKIASAYLDSKVKLGIAQALLLIQDNLTECFDMLKCDGVRYLDFNVFWVFTKARVKFVNRPCWREDIEAESFPISNAGFRTNVNTVFYKDGKPIILANQEACVLDKEKHRPVKLTGLPFPKENFPQPLYSEAFEKFDIDEQLFQEVYTQQIRSQNIDMSGHMNNNEYVKLALNVFSNDFLLNHEPDVMEVHFTGESKEGQILSVKKAEKNGSTFIKIFESERCVFEMKISFVESKEA